MREYKINNFQFFLPLLLRLFFRSFFTICLSTHVFHRLTNRALYPLLPYSMAMLTYLILYKTRIDWHFNFLFPNSHSILNSYSNRLNVGKNEFRTMHLWESPFPTCCPFGVFHVFVLMYRNGELLKNQTKTYFLFTNENVMKI